MKHVYDNNLNMCISIKTDGPNTRLFLKFFGKVNNQF